MTLSEAIPNLTYPHTHTHTHTMSELCVRKRETERERGRKWRRNEDGEWSKRQGVVEKRDATRIGV